MPAKWILILSMALACLNISTGVSSAQDRQLAQPRVVPTPSTEAAPQAAADGANCGQPGCAQQGCAPAKRIRVVIPEPEIVYRYASPTTDCAAPACKGPDAGMIAFNMNLNMGAGFNGGFGGNNLLSALGGLQSGGAGNSALEMALLRSLLARAGGTAADNGGSTGSADLEAQIRKLSTSIDALHTRMDNEVLTANRNLTPALKQIVSELDELKDAVDKLKANQGKPAAKPPGR